MAPSISLSFMFQLSGVKIQVITQTFFFNLPPHIFTYFTYFTWDSIKPLSINFLRVLTMIKKPLGSSKVGARYQVTIPKEAREEFRFKVGDIVIFIRENDKLILTKSIG